MKKVFLTGASSGIGLAIAKMLSTRGDEVWGTSRDPSRLPQLPRLHPIQLDLSDPIRSSRHSTALSPEPAISMWLLITPGAVILALRNIFPTPRLPASFKSWFLDTFNSWVWHWWRCARADTG